MQPIELRHLKRGVLSRSEAQQLLVAAANNKEVQKRLLNKAHVAHGDLLVYRDLVQYFATEHPAAANGEPLVWPGRPANAVAFEQLNAEETAALAQWYRMQPEYIDAVRNPRHPDSKIPLEEIGQITDQMSRLGAREPDAANKPAQQQSLDTAAVSADIQELQADPAVWNKADPGHAAALARLTAAYEGLSAPAGARSTAGDAARPAIANKTASERAAELQADPAYRNASHPDHRAVVNSMAAALSEPGAMAPASPAAGEGGKK